MRTKKLAFILLLSSTMSCRLSEEISPLDLSTNTSAIFSTSMLHTVYVPAALLFLALLLALFAFVSL